MTRPWTATPSKPTQKNLDRNPPRSLGFARSTRVPIPLVSRWCFVNPSLLVLRCSAQNSDLTLSLLRPFASLISSCCHCSSLKHRRSAVSPLGRRKRVSSLSEASPLSQGKEGAEDYFDYEANEFGVADAPFGARGPSSQTTSRWPASSTESAFGNGAQGYGNGFGNRGASHSLPSASALSFSPSASRGPSSAFSSVNNGASAQFNGAGSMGRNMNGGFGSPNSNPIPIPNRHDGGFSSNSFAPNGQGMMPGQYGFGSPIKPHAQKYATFTQPPLVPSHSHPHLQMHQGMSMGPAPPMGMAHHHHSTGALPVHMHGNSSLLNSHNSLSGSNTSVSSSSSNAGMFGSHGSPSSSASHSSHKKKSRNARSRLDNHQCPNCHTSDSPLWRNCQIKGKILHLCNSCGLRYKKHKYCPHCYKVYYDAETNSHEWTQCAQCHNWTHKSCLSAAGIDSGAPGTYKCVRCLGQSPDSA